MATIKTLLLSGANNHDWTMSSPFIRNLLEQTGRFEVTVTENPSAMLEDAKALAGCSLIFMDYNGPEWSAKAKAHFEAAVAGGAGLVVMHAADNAFTGWVEFEKMVGQLWRQGTSHGRFHEFPVTFVDRDHPITQGLADYRTTDELYHNLVHMHNVKCHVLATAFSSTESGGTGKQEPVHVVMQYGGGRVFHQVLGHVWPGNPNMVAFENEGFKRVTLRACEWAAAGKVTL
jgi:type 1 glutamine amidotransferase